MDAVTVTFLAIGGVGVLFLLIGVLVGDFGGPDADGPFSLPAVAAFLGGVGFGGAIASATFGATLSPGLDVVLSALVGLVVALPLAWAALRLSARLSGLRTDATLSSAHLLGSVGVVVTPIGPTGYGEVRLEVGGHSLKYYARSATPLALGTPVYVVDTPSETSVEVVSATDDPPPDLLAGSAGHQA